jgi:hypothetical protein
MSSTLDTQEPAAAEGGATNYQSNLNDEIWRIMQEFHARLSHDNYTIEDLVNHIHTYWESEEIDKPNRTSIIEAVTLFETQQKRCNLGEFRRVRKGVYGFWQ